MTPRNFRRLSGRAGRRGRQFKKILPELMIPRGFERLLGAARPRRHLHSGVVQIRVTPKTRNPFAIKALSISGVTWEWHFLNHAADHQAARIRAAEHRLRAVA